MRKVAEFDIGRYVECDSCGTALTDDPRSGGFIFGSQGVGPCCCDSMLVSIRHYDEERYIGAYCPKSMSFADWIRWLRSRRSDGNVITVWAHHEDRDGAS